MIDMGTATGAGCRPVGLAVAHPKGPRRRLGFGHPGCAVGLTRLPWDPRKLTSSRSVADTAVLDRAPRHGTSTPFNSSVATPCRAVGRSSSKCVGVSLGILGFQLEPDSEAPRAGEMPRKQTLQPTSCRLDAFVARGPVGGDAQRTASDARQRVDRLVSRRSARFVVPVVDVIEDPLALLRGQPAESAPRLIAVDDIQVQGELGQSADSFEVFPFAQRRLVAVRNQIRLQLQSWTDAQTLDTGVAAVGPLTRGVCGGGSHSRFAAVRRSVSPPGRSCLTSAKRPRPRRSATRPRQCRRP